MRNLRSTSSNTQTILPHVLAGGAALYYAWFISSTAYVTTAVQFISPVAIIIIAHLIWRAIFGELAAGFSRQILGQTVLTALVLTAATIGFALLAPMPAEADSSGIVILGWILVVIACLGFVAVVIFVVAAITLAIARLFGAIANSLRGNKKPPNDKLNDFATIGIALFGVVALSLEGTTARLNFPANGVGLSSRFVKAEVEKVWRAAETATSPDFPLPTLLYAIPQPVKILRDEGLDLGAKRVVQIAGREGSGELSMEIIRRTATEATFKVVSDTSPVAKWVAAKNLTFKIEPVEGGTMLTVSSEFDRGLSPAWFFQPLMNFAAYIAVDTLARDVTIRAEGV